VLNFPSPEKILLLAIIALVVLGPSRLPHAARTAGKWIAELRKLTSRLQEEVSGALGDPKDALTSSLGDLRNEVGVWRNEMVGLGRSVTTTPTAAAATWSPAPSSSVPEPTPWADASPSYPSSYPSPPGSTAAGLPLLPPAPDDPSLN
jgi:sec-independent protein translocase protein TatB